MKSAYIYLTFLFILPACDLRSRNQKAVDEMAAKMPKPANMNAGKQNYSLYIPNGWSTEHRQAFGVDFYYLFAPQTKDDPNTIINVATEAMQNAGLDKFRTQTIESVKRTIPSAANFAQGEVIANGVQGGWYSYTMEPQGIRAALVTYIFPKNGVAYIITAGTQTRDASRYRSLFDSVARSLQFVEPVPVKVRHN